MIATPTQALVSLLIAVVLMLCCIRIGLWLTNLNNSKPMRVSARQYLIIVVLMCLMILLCAVMPELAGKS